jgi:integrase
VIRNFLWEAQGSVHQLPLCFPLAGGIAVKLNARTVARLKLPEGKTEHIFFDGDLKKFGVRLRLSEIGHLSRTHVVQYRTKGRQRRITIGNCEELTPEQARAAAKAILAKVALGEDPQGEKQAQRLGAALTLRSVVLDYLAAKQSTLRPASYRMAKLYLLTGSYFRALHSYGINSITRAHIAQRLNSIIQNSGRVTAHMARSALLSLYTWALQQGIVEQNPVVGTEDPGPAKSRDRTLSDSEIVAVWSACLDDDYGWIIKLLICLGMRREEVGGLRWSEINLDDGTITLPAERVKNGRAHVLPLLGLAQSIIASIPQRTGRDHVFGTRSSGGHTGWDRCKKDLNARLADKVGAFRVHDLRRSVATGMANLGVEPHIIEAVLNHYSGHRRGVAGDYNRAKYARQIRSALALWDDQLQSIISGGKHKVVPFPQQETA